MNITKDNLEECDIGTIILSMIYPIYGAGMEEGRLVRKILRKYESLFVNTDNFEPLDITVVPTPGEKDIFD